MKEIEKKKRRSFKIFSSQGRIALPLIVLVALCILDEFWNVLHFGRRSMLVVLVLSFPLGLLASGLATWLAEMFAPQQSLLADGFVFVAAMVGTVLNIYLFAACIVRCLKLLRSTAQGMPISAEEFQRLLQEHRKRDS